MTRRNFILLIIVLLVVLVLALAFLYFRQPAPTAENPTSGPNFFATFNPFRNNPAPAKPAPREASPEVPPPPEAPVVPIVENLKKVSSMPVAGYIAYKKERYKELNTPATGGSGGKPTSPVTEFATALRYVDRATGNVYQTFADKIEEIKFSSTTIPKVYEAYFGTGATTVVMRYLKGEQIIETFAGKLPKEVLGWDSTVPNELKGLFLPENIPDVSLSPDRSKLFYLLPAGDGVSGAIYNFADGKKIQIFGSPFTEWLSAWPSAGTLTLTTKPSASVAGYMYALNTTTKSFSRVLGGVNGLTTLPSPNGKMVLYSDSNLTLSIFHSDTKTSDLAGVRTLPEKCVWAPDSLTIYCAAPKTIPPAAYPDAWYQGEVSFNDALWRIDVTTGKTTIIADPATYSGKEEIDGIKLALDPNGDYLFFVNKKNSILWEFKMR